MVTNLAPQVLRVSNQHGDGLTEPPRDGVLEGIRDPHARRSTSRRACRLSGMPDPPRSASARRSIPVPVLNSHESSDGESHLRWCSRGALVPGAIGSRRDGMNDLPTARCCPASPRFRASAVGEALRRASAEAMAESRRVVPAKLTRCSVSRSGSRARPPAAPQARPAALAPADARQGA